MKIRIYFAIVILILLCITYGAFAQEWYPIDAGVKVWDSEFNDVFFADEKNGWIVGDQGKIIHTGNGGNWDEQDSGVGATLYAVHFTNSTNGWVVGNYGIILHTVDGGNTWIISQSDTGESLFDICFVTENIGWIVGSNGVILYTDNGGNTWQKSLYESNDLYAVHFDSVNNGWVAGKNGTILYWNGEKWNKEQIPVSVDLYGIYTKGAGNVWAVGENGIIIHKSGSVWSQVGTSSDTRLNDVILVNEQYGWIAGDYATLLYTNNVGSSWGTQKVPTTSHINSVFAVNSSKAWAVGENGVIIQTVDGGLSWVTPPSYGDLMDVCFPKGEALKGWIAGENGLLLHTENAGEAWNEQTSPTTDTLNNIYFLDAFNGWAVGESGTIIHTTDGFKWDLVMSNPSGRSLRGVQFLDSNNGWVVGDFGTVLYWNGLVWEQQTIGTTKHLYGIYFINSSIGWIVGDSGLILNTTNGGQKWSEVSSGTNMLLRGIRFFDVNNAIAVGNLGVIVKTSDGGKTWFLKNSGTTAPLYDIEYVSSNEIWVTGANRIILHTTNGGEYWDAKTLLPAKSTIYGVDFTSSESGIVVGKSGTIVRYTSNAPAVEFKLLSPYGDIYTLTPTFKWTTTRRDVTHTIFIGKNPNPFDGTNLYQIPVIYETSYTLPKGIELNPDTYYWGIEAADGTRSKPEEILKFTSWPPAEIVLLSPFGYIKTSKPTFEWKWVENVTYKLFIDSDANPFDSKNIDVGRETKYTILDSDQWKNLPEGMYRWGIEGNDDGQITKSSVGTFTVDLSPPKGKIEINGGSKATNSFIVTLNLSASDPLGDANTGGSGVVQMQLSNNGTTWADPETFTSPEMAKTWDLRGFGGNDKDGLKTVFVRYKDALDHWSDPIKAEITLDSESPNGTIVINSGAEATKDYDVTLTFSASGVSEMILSNNGSEWTGALTFEATRQWNLLSYPGGSDKQGIRTVYVKFKDSAGNWMEQPASDTIKLDRTGPNGTIVINDNAIETNSLNVTLTLSANDESEVKEMKFSNGNDKWSPAEPYKTTKENWNLSEYGGDSKDGLKKVFVRFTDGLGNETQPAIEDSINFKSKVIISSLSISSKVAGKVKNGDTVQVDGKAEQGAEITSRELIDENGKAIDVGLGGITYDLNTGSIKGSFGVGTLTAKNITLKLIIKDKIGNEAEKISNMLTVDNDPPYNASVIIDSQGVINTKTISVGLAVTDAKEMYLDGDIKAITGIDNGLRNWVSYKDKITLTVTDKDGTKTIKAKFRDDMGNESAEVSDSIIIDATAPKGSIVINDGAELTGSFIVTLKLSTTDTNGVNGYQLSNDGTTWTSSYVYPKDSPTYEVKGWDLRLFGGNSNSGQRTVYVKYKDVPGNWSAVFSDNINIDATPPNISLIPISDKQEAMKSVTVSAVVKDNKSVAEVNLFYRKKGTIEYTKVAMVKLPGDWYSAEIPASEVTQSGIEYYLEASDGLSISRWQDENAAVNPKSFTVIDTTPPNIEHEPILEISVKNSPKMTAKVTDAVGVDRVNLNYKLQSEKNYTKVSMKLDSGNALSGVYSASIPALDIPNAMDYYIEAYDTSSNLRTSPINGSKQPFVLSFVDTEPPVVVHKPISNGHEAGTPVTIGANITDNVGVDKVVFKYRPPGKTELIEVKMTNVGSYYSVEIPSNVLMPGKVDYIISVSDASKQSDDVEISYSFTVVDTTPPKIELVSAPSKEEVYKDILIQAKITDNVSIASVTFYYKNVTDTKFNSVVMRGTGNNYSATIPRQNQIGEVKYYILAKDSQGFLTTEPSGDPESIPRIVTIYDSSSPIIQHIPIVSQFEAGTAVTINATVTDDVQVKEVTLHYGLAGVGSFKIAPMTETTTKSVYTGNIPADQVMPTGVEYYIKAVDNSGNVTTHPATNPDKLPHTFRVVDTVPPDIIYDATKLTKVQLLEPINIAPNVADRIGIREVRVYYKLEGENDFTLLACKNLGDTRYSATIPSPLYQTMIYYYIQAEDNSGNTITSPKQDPKGKPYSVFVEDKISPEPPTRLSVLPEPGGKIKLTWELSKSLDVGKYNIYTDGGSGTIDYLNVYDSVDSTKNSWESTTLGEGVYKFAVRAIDKSGNEEKNTAFVSVEADAVKPESPTGITAKSVADGKIELNWNLSLSRDTSVYNIYWDNAQAYMDYSKPLARVNDPGTKWVSDKLRDGIVYRFIVRSQDKAGNEDENANIVSARADSTPPSIVAVLSNSTHKFNVWSNQSKIVISWLPSQDVISGLAGYSIVWDSNEKTLPDQTIDITDPSTTQLTYEPADLQKVGYVKLYFHIRPVDKSGNWSVEGSHFGPFLIDIKSPEPPQSVEAIPQPDGKIKMMWQKSGSDDVVKYNVYWDNGTGEVDYSKASAVLSADNGGSATYSWITPSLIDGKTYRFSVRAIDQADNEEKNLKVVSAIADDQKPSITHKPIKALLEQEIMSVDISAVVDDAGGIDNVALYYRKHGETKYTNRKMTEEPSNTYTAEIPSSVFSSAGVDYYISATDKAGNVATYSVTTISIVKSLQVAIDPTKENEILLGDGSSIYFPAGAVPSGTNLFITIPSVIPEPQEGLKKHIISREFSLDKELLKPITITLHYSDSKIAGEDESKLAMYIWNGNKWEYLVSVKSNENSAIVSTMNTGIFSIIGDYEPPIIKDLLPSGYSEPDAGITAKIIENGSGVNAKKIEVVLNNTKIDVPETAFKEGVLSLAFPQKLGLGHYTLQVSVIDRVENKAISASEFDVTDKLTMINTYCYPNPFDPKIGANFAYTLTESADEVKIRIFSMDGRLVKEIDGTTRIGNNIVKWDCDDEAGDQVLSSVYICYIEAKSSKAKVNQTIKIAGW